jgi:hypothetical protein
MSIQERVFQRSALDPNLNIKISGKGIVILLVHVDDLIITEYDRRKTFSSCKQSM